MNKSKSFRCETKNDFYKNNCYTNKLQSDVTLDNKIADLHPRVISEPFQEQRLQLFISNYSFVT